MASSPAPPGHHDERHESTSSSADDDEITAAAEASPEQGGGGGRGTGGSGSAAAEGDQKGKGKVVEGSQEAAKKDKVDSQLKKFIRRSFLAVSEGFKKKLSDRQGKQLDGASTSNSPPHVDHKKIPMEEAVYHYFGDIHNVLRLSKRERESVIIMRLVPLHSHYSALRPVYRDGESFYRSFIFSYLEQIVDRVDMGEEDRLLAAVRELARRAEHFQWASEFPRRREAFEKLIEKIKGWKRMLQYPTLRVRFLKRYNRGEFLLEFFSSYDTTDDNTHYNVARGTPRVSLLLIESRYGIIYALPPSAATPTSRPNQPRPDPVARPGFWWFDCCFVVPKESLLQGSTA
uniref:Uncharacterized protein n=1 Tax=Oryza barthii TaxID=65489 RepID=A0A0D3F5S8_9ORYZ